MSVPRIEPPRRNVRRRERTRRLILEAAHEVLALKGVEAATVAEITQAADVGFGSFYNYFGSKRELLEAAIAHALEGHGHSLETRIVGMTDPAEILAASIRHAVQFAETDPVWGAFVVRFGLLERSLRARLGSRARRELRRGIASGRFTPADPATALVAIGGAVLSVIQGRLDGTLTANAGPELADQVLRMLGVPRNEAARIARSELPPPM